MAGKAVEEAGKLAEELLQQAQEAQVATDDGGEAVELEPVQELEAEGGEPAQAAPATDEWKHRYDTLQGMFNNEVPKLQSQIAFLQGMLADKAGQEKQAVSEVADTKPSSSAVEELKTEYPYVYDAVIAINEQYRVRILNEVGATINQLMGRFNQVETGVGQTQAAIFWSTLTALVPDWEVWNTNQGFIDWLNQVDPLSRYRRMDMLSQAKSSYDAEGTAAFFNEYKKLTGAVTSPNKGPDKAARVAPGRSTGSVGSTQQLENKTQLSRQDIQQFYLDVKMGRYKGKEQEMQAVENKINQMAMEMSGRR